MAFERQMMFWLAALAVFVAAAVAAERHPAAVRRRHGARLSARPADRPARAARRQPAGRRAADHHAGGAGVRRADPAGRADRWAASSRPSSTTFPAMSTQAADRCSAIRAGPGCRSCWARGFDADKSIGDLVTQGVGWLTTLPAIAVVGRPRAGLAVLAGGGDAGRRVLPALRLAPHDRAPSTAGCRCSSATRCAGWRARSTPRSPASCAGRPRSA